MRTANDLYGNTNLYKCTCVFSLKQWVLIEHLCWKCSLPATRMRSWLQTICWITSTSLRIEVEKRAGLVSSLIFLHLSPQVWLIVCFELSLSLFSFNGFTWYIYIISSLVWCLYLVNAGEVSETRICIYGLLCLHLCLLQTFSVPSILWKLLIQFTAFKTVLEELICSCFAS